MNCYVYHQDKIKERELALSRKDPHTERHFQEVMNCISCHTGLVHDEMKNKVLPRRDLALMNAMAYVIIAEGRTDEKFISEHMEFVKGADEKLTYDQFKAFLQDYAPEKVADACGIPAETIREVARLFSALDRNTMSLCCMDLNQRTRGVWVNNLVHNLHLLTGKICRPGNTPFSLTG